MSDKYLSQAVLACIEQVATAVPGENAALEYVNKRYGIEFDDNQLHMKNRDDAFDGKWPTLSAKESSQSVEQNLSTEHIPALSFILLDVAANDNLGNKEALSLVYHLADANQVLRQQVLAIFNKTYLQELNLTFDNNTSNIVDITTKRMPRGFEAKMQQLEDAALSKFKEALIEGNFIDKITPITVMREEIDFNLRDRAKSLVSEAPQAKKSVEMSNIHPG